MNSLKESIIGMSEYYGYVCRTCQQGSEHWLNHGEMTLRAIALNAVKIKEIQELDRQVYIGLNFFNPYSDIMDWIEEHAGHDIALHSEYGDVHEIEQPTTDRPVLS